MRLGALVRAGLVALSGIAMVLAGPVATPAKADPTLDDARAQLERIERQQSEIGEQWAEVKLKLGRSRAKVDTLNADILAQQRKVDGLTSRARQAALNRFQNHAVDPTLRLVTATDPDSFLADVSRMNKFDQNLNSLLQDYQVQQAQLAGLRRSAREQLNTVAAEEKRLAELKSQIDAKIREGQALVDRLTEQERARLAAEEAASRDASRTAVAAAVEIGDDDSGKADARALAAVKYAVSKVPAGQYVWGAEGPNSFDCSGLMLAAYRTVGVSLPHSSRAQSRLGRPVARDQLKPGDLLFFYNPIHHVGMYIGDGLFVHARNPRNDLEITQLSAYPAYQGARRVVG